MKVIAINGSPRKNGNTATMLQKILDGSAEKGAETRMIHLNALDMKGCQGCLACREKLGECAYDDDFQEVLREMKECDAVALGTPIYAFHITGQFKCFLDRCYCFIDHTEDDEYISVLPKGKKFALVTSQGDESREAYKHVIEYLQLLLSFLSGSTLEVITQAGTEDKTDARNDARLMQAARAVGKSLAL
jgi:multimeric flavodoxin WrbA